jgi:predicted nucleotidyltransferase
MSEVSGVETSGAHRVNPPWACIISDEQWNVYRDAIRITRQKGAPFLIGGAFALAGYTGRCRNTKDLDLFVLPSDKDKVVDALTKIGFEDYFPTLAYDRGWIYRATRGGVIVDVIWQTPNRRTQVDVEWLHRARELVLRNERLKIVPAEELLAIKLYVLQRDRCDWPDLINLLYCTCHELDWEHIFGRMGPEMPLLISLLNLFNWVAPRQALCLPDFVREKVHLPKPSEEDLSLDPQFRVNLLDSRPWFAAFQPKDKAMEL